MPALYGIRRELPGEAPDAPGDPIPTLGHGFDRGFHRDHLRIGGSDPTATTGRVSNTPDQALLPS